VKKKNILVTGAGSGVGQSIIKSLKFSKFPCNIFPADIDYLNSFLHISKNSLLVPKVENEKKAINWYLKNIKKFNINLIMIGSEYDTNFFLKFKKLIKNKTDCEVCISKAETVKLSNDKYLTQLFLKKNQLPFLKTYIPKNINDAKKMSKKFILPFVLKPRFGTSSKNVYIVSNYDELISNFKKIKKPIIQEYIGNFKNNFETEYTCSFFVTKEKKILGPITMRRKLINGTSWITEVVKNEKIDNIILRIAKILKVEGPFNIQLGIGKNGPVPFEFNCRYSGTTCIRAYFGFNEPLMYLKNYILNKKLLKPRIKNGSCFRYLNEIFLDDCSINELSKHKVQGKIMKWI